MSHEVRPVALITEKQKIHRLTMGIWIVLYPNFARGFGF